MLETTPVAETDGQMREQLIKNHFSGRVLGLTSEKQTADSKALHFHAEVSHVCSTSSMLLWSEDGKE